MSMKNVVQHGLILLLFTGLAAGCHAQSRPGNDPALQKAADWIKTQLPKAGASGSSAIDSWSDRYSNVAINGCSLTFTRQYNEDHSRYYQPEGEKHIRETDIFTVPLDKLSSAAWEAPSSPGDAGQIALKASSEVITAKMKKTVSTPNGPPEITNEVNKFSGRAIDVQDDSYLGLSAAFSRAIQLCSGKGGDSSPQANNGASMDETLQLITMGLQKAGYQVSDSMTKEYDNLSYSDVAAKSCSVTFAINRDSEIADMGRQHSQEKYLVTVPLGKLSGASVVSQVYDSVKPVKESLVVLSASGKVIPESWKKIVDNGSSPQIVSGSDNFDSLRIHTTDPAFAGNLANAFSRGIQLCGGKTAF